MRTAVSTLTIVGNIIAELFIKENRVSTLTIVGNIIAELFIEENSSFQHSPLWGISLLSCSLRTAVFNTHHCRECHCWAAHQGEQQFHVSSSAPRSSWCNLRLPTPTWAGQSLSPLVHTPCKQSSLLSSRSLQTRQFAQLTLPVNKAVCLAHTPCKQSSLLSSHSLQTKQFACLVHTSCKQSSLLAWLTLPANSLLA